MLGETKDGLGCRIFIVDKQASLLEPFCFLFLQNRLTNQGTKPGLGGGTFSPCGRSPLLGALSALMLRPRSRPPRSSTPPASLREDDQVVVRLGFCGVGKLKSIANLSLSDRRGSPVISSTAYPYS